MLYMYIVMYMMNIHNILCSRTLPTQMTGEDSHSLDSHIRDKGIQWEKMYELMFGWSSHLMQAWWGCF